jgi:hypothetical protein
MEKRDRNVETPADLLRRKLLEIIAINRKVTFQNGKTTKPF